MWKTYLFRRFPFAMGALWLFNNRRTIIAQVKRGFGKRTTAGV